MVPLPHLGQPLAPRRRQRAHVPFVVLLEVDLVLLWPMGLPGRQLGAEVNARVVGLGFASAPVDVEHEIAVLLLAAHEPLARLEHQQAVFNRHVAFGDDPMVEALAIEQDRFFTCLGSEDRSRNETQQRKGEAWASKHREDSWRVMMGGKLANAPIVSCRQAVVYHWQTKVLGQSNRENSDRVKT